MALKPKIYFLEWVLAANQAIEKTFSISELYSWTMIQMTHEKTGDAEIQFLKVGDEDMLDKPTRISLITGNNSRLLVLPQPLYVPKKGTVSVKVADKSGVANTVVVGFIGVKSG